MSAVLAGIQKGMETSRDLLVPACQEVIGPAAGLKAASGVVVDTRRIVWRDLTDSGKLQNTTKQKKDTGLNLNFR